MATKAHISCPGEIVSWTFPVTELKVPEIQINGLPPGSVEAGFDPEALMRGVVRLVITFTPHPKVT